MKQSLIRMKIVTKQREKKLPRLTTTRVQRADTFTVVAVRLIVAGMKLATNGQKNMTFMIQMIVAVTLSRL